MLTALQTESGPSYIDLAAVVLVSASFQKHGHEAARAIGLQGGHKVYCLDNEHNRLKLAELIPLDAPALASAAPLRPTRGRRLAEDDSKPKTRARRASKED